MKVKVNGVWKDHVSFLHREKIGDVAVLEGEITLSSSVYIVKIEHNLGIVPFMAVAEVVGEQEPQYNKVTLLRNFVGTTNGIHSTQYNTSLAISAIGNTGSSNMIFTDKYVQMSTGSTSRTLYPATYKYKIYYEL